MGENTTTTLSIVFLQPSLLLEASKQDFQDSSLADACLSSIQISERQNFRSNNKHGRYSRMLRDTKSALVAFSERFL